MKKILSEFSNRLGSVYPMFSQAVTKAYDLFGENWADECVESLIKMFGHADKQGWDEAIRGYALFSVDALKSQGFYERHGHYAASNYAEVKREYWDNPDFMLSNYMPGMFLSYFLWPHHYRLILFYRNRICHILKQSTPSIQTFCEIGVGTGIYSRETLRALPDARGTGYDISEHSLSFCRRGMTAFDLIDRYALEKRDILSNPPEPVDYLICQEVLEHLEDPARFCQGLFQLVKPGGKAYITAAITAAHSDHIYLYKIPDEAREHVESAGFNVREEKTEGAEDFSKAQPRITCFLCERP